MARNSNPPKKTPVDHSEDALYREVWEEVNAKKAIDFIKKNSKVIIIASIVLLLIVSSFVILKNIKHSNLMEVSVNFESAMNMDPKLAKEALTRVAKSTSGGMADLALYNAAMFSLKAGDIADGISKLSSLADDGATRDFRDVAAIELGVIKGDNLSASEFQKLLSQVLTKRSPFYFTALLMVSEKYISENKQEEAAPFLEKILGDKDAPASISGAAEMLVR